MIEDTRTAAPERAPVRDTGALLLAAGGLTAAFGAASCCALPLLLGSLGLGSAWLVTVAWFAAPHRLDLVAVRRLDVRVVRRLDVRLELLAGFLDVLRDVARLVVFGRPVLPPFSSPRQPLAVTTTPNFRAAARMRLHAESRSASETPST